MEAPQVPKKVPKRQDPEEVIHNLPPGIFDSIFATDSIPPMQYRTPGLGVLFENFLVNWEMKQLGLFYERLAYVEEQSGRVMRARTEKVIQAVTFGKQIQAAVKRIDHEMTMLDIDEEKIYIELDGGRMKNLQAKAEYQRLMAEIRAIDVQLEHKNAVEPENGHQDG